MEPKFQLTANGQELQKVDVNQVAEEAALADDRVFAELTRMAYYNGSLPSRAVMPFVDYSNVSGTGGVPRNWLLPGTGSLTIMPFRAFIGSRTTAASDATKNLRDIRSSIVVGTSALAQTLVFAANISANPRWDLVYAAISVEANSPTTTRFVKDPATNVITPTTVVTTTTDGFSLGIVQGTPDATSPALPVRPTDAAGVYYIPLAYVAIPGTFTTSTVLDIANLMIVAPIVGIASALGVSTSRPASALYDPAGSAITSTFRNAWILSGFTPEWQLAPDGVGGESLILQLDFTGSSTNWTLRNGEVIDNLRNWGSRYFVSTIAYTANLASEVFAATAPLYGGQPWPNGNSSTSVLTKFGQSFAWDQTLQVGALGNGAVFRVTNVDLTGGGLSWIVGAYVDITGGNHGRMKFYVSGTPTGKFWIKLDSIYCSPTVKGT